MPALRLGYLNLSVLRYRRKLFILPTPIPVMRFALRPEARGGNHINPPARHVQTEPELETLETQIIETEPVQDDISQKPKSPRRRSSKKPTFTQDKNLNLFPKDGPSFESFAAEKAPATVILKSVVTVYWLRQHAGVSPITANHVYTCFKAANWMIPNDLVNTLSQAGTKGFVDSSSRDDISLTTLGENLVEHKLPAIPKA